jgi:hypothetical protein
MPREKKYNIYAVDANTFAQAVQKDCRKVFGIDTKSVWTAGNNISTFFQRQVLK